MATVRYEPWTVISHLQNDINRLFGSLNEGEGSSATAEWMPAVDVCEYADRFELLVDLPGVDPKVVEITLENGVLTVAGERSEEKWVSGNEPGQARQQRMERRMGRFHRRFILPDTADAENVNATGRNGVLEISIAKQARIQPRRIAVT